MTFDDPRTVEMLTWQLKYSDWSRSQTRRRINNLFNGYPPYTPDEVEKNNIPINFNDLASTRAGHTARAQGYNAFMSQDRYFSARTDRGPKHKRSEFNTAATQSVAKIMKRNLPYFEKMRSTIASDVLHGVGPSTWEDKDRWCPQALGMDDILIPSDTLLTMKNLPFFAIYRTYTAPELMRMTRKTRRDPGWNMPLVERCLKWVDEQSRLLMGDTFNDFWSPEKMGERLKDSGWYMGDRVPTVDTFQFYYWSDEGKTEGWRRRIILDMWGTPEVVGGVTTMSRRKGSIYEKAGGYLYNSKARVYGDRLSELVSFQFADLSAVAPFKYHSVRSLGFLLYTICHLQNRLRCAFSKAVFEQLMQLFRVNSEEDMQRVLKVELIDKGFLDPSVNPIPASERWQVNAGLIQMALGENRSLIQQSTASYAQSTDFSQDRTEKTKFQVMAELQGMTAMLNAGLIQAYEYQRFEYIEIFRRFCKKNSNDPDVREFRNECLKQGIPEELIVPEAWEIEPVQVMGAGNTSLQLTIAQQLLEMLPLFDPTAKQAVLRDSVFAITQDAAKTKVYVPEGPRAISNSVHDAQNGIGTILQGGVVSPVDGQNHHEVVVVWLKELEKRIQAVNAMGGVPSTSEVLMGMQNLARHIAQQIVIISSDENEKPRVKQYSDVLTRMLNELRAFEQRLQEQMEAQNADSGLDPKVAGEIQALIIKAQANAKIKMEQASQRMAQNELKFRQKIRHDQKIGQLQEQTLDMSTAAEIMRENARKAAEPETDGQADN